MTGRHRDLGHRLNDINNDVALTLARFDEAIELLGAWCDDHPDSDLARMSRSLIVRCLETNQ